MANIISVYCDATALRAAGEIGESELLGAWAFYIPDLHASKSEITTGLFNTDLELVGAVRGIQLAVSKTTADCAINVCTDEHGVHSWIHELRRRIDGKTKRNGGRPSRAGSQTRVLAELHALGEIMRGRLVLANLVQSSVNGDHRLCHDLCRRTLRDYLRRERPDLMQKLLTVTDPVAFDRAVKERQRCLDRAAELTRWLNDNFY